MKNLLLAVLFVCACCANAADIDIWKGVKMPRPQNSKIARNVGVKKDERYKSIGKPFMRYFEAQNASGEPAAAVLIFGGGGYNQLALERDAIPAAKLLSENGIASFVLAYRLPDNRDGALMDAQRAIRLMRKNAKKLNIDPEKIGVMGFSAGGHLAARLANEGEDFYEKTDAADEISKNVAFTILIYPAYLADKKSLELSPEIKVSKDSPRAFIMQTQDDAAYEASSVGYMLALRAAGAPVDFHYFKKGGHGYALRIQDIPAAAWSDLLLTWLKFNGISR
ncbi:MAG: alpha/beta hydrolase [Opitutales bacterium]|nr:alpha/beta hydrolase [Opitutales bacterium]